MLYNKNYTVLPKQSVDIWCESVGVGKLPDDVSEILAEDITYRLREVVHNAMESMKQSKRTCLTVDDMNFALNETNSETIYGHGGPDVVTFKALQDHPICYIDEKDINLRDIALDNHHPEPTPDILLKANWSVIEGRSISSSSSTHSSYKDLTEKKTLKAYLELLLKSIHEQNEDILKLLFRDLSMATNGNIEPMIGQILHYFNDMILNQCCSSNGIKCERLISNFCSILQALLMNDNIFITKHTSRIIDILCRVITSCDLPACHWSIFDKVAFLLARFCRHGNDVSANNYIDDVMKTFTMILNDVNASSAKLYSTLVGINAFGAEAVNSIYQVILKRLDQSNNDDKSVEAVMVSHGFRLCLLSLLREHRKNRHFTSSSNIYALLYSHYGDNIINRTIDSGKSFYGCSEHGNIGYLVRKAGKIPNIISDLLKPKIEKVTTAADNTEIFSSSLDRNRATGIHFRLKKRKFYTSHEMFRETDDKLLRKAKKSKMDVRNRHNVKRFRSSVYDENKVMMTSSTHIQFLFM